jgi:uncharacterized protein YggL (DUF469 family)
MICLKNKTKLTNNLQKAITNWLKQHKLKTAN